MIRTWREGDDPSEISVTSERSPKPVQAGGQEKSIKNQGKNIKDLKERGSVTVETLTRRDDHNSLTSTWPSGNFGPSQVRPPVIHFRVVVNVMWIASILIRIAPLYWRSRRCGSSQWVWLAPALSRSRYVLLLNNRRAISPKHTFSESISRRSLRGICDHMWGVSWGHWYWLYIPSTKTKHSP